MISPVLAVKDLDVSIAFYEKLGFTKDFAMPGPDGINAFGFVKFGDGNAIGLSRQPTDNVGRGVVLMVYLPKEVNLTDLYEAVKAKNIPIVEELKTEYWGDQLFSVHDPDGYYLTLTQTVQKPDMEHMAAVMRGDLPSE